MYLAFFLIDLFERLFMNGNQCFFAIQQNGTVKKYSFMCLFSSFQCFDPVDELCVCFFKCIYLLLLFLYGINLSM